MKTTLSDINYDEIVYENKDSNGEIHNIEARTSKMIYLDLFGDLYGKERSYIIIYVMVMKWGSLVMKSDVYVNKILRSFKRT